MSKFEEYILDDTANMDSLDLVIYNANLGSYHIGSDFRTEEWHKQSASAKISGAYEGETTLLYTSPLALTFKLMDGFLLGPENRNEGGIADVIITKHNKPLVHVEYKSQDGNGFL